MTASNLAIPAEDIPVRLRCAMCSNLARNAYKLGCCEQSICGSCQSNLPGVCKICDHSPLRSEDCKPNGSLRTTVTIFLRTAERKYQKVKQPTPEVPGAASEESGAAMASNPPTEAHGETPSPVNIGNEDSFVSSEVKTSEETVLDHETEDGGEKKDRAGVKSQGLDTTGHANLQGNSYWNNSQFPDQNGQFSAYGDNNMNWGYGQSYGAQGAWNNGMQSIGGMNSYSGMQSYPNNYSAGMGMGFLGYGQGNYGSNGMGMQGQGNWGNDWNMQNGMDGSNFNSSGINSGFYPGAGGYNHQTYGNHQSQQNHMMPHQQFQNRGFNHNQYRNLPNQNMRGSSGNYGQQQHGGFPRNHRGHDGQMQQQISGNDASDSLDAISGVQDESLNLEQTPASVRSRGESSEKILVGEVTEVTVDDPSKSESDPKSSMTSETAGATSAIQSINLKDSLESPVLKEQKAFPDHIDKKTQSQDHTNQNTIIDTEQQNPMPGVAGAPTGPRAMRERGERGRGRGRGGFFAGSGRGGYHQSQFSGSDEISKRPGRNGSITSNGKNFASGAEGSDYDVNASRRQSRADDAQSSLLDPRKEVDENFDREDRRSRSRSRVRKHRRHRSRSRKRSSSPKTRTRNSSRDRSRSRDHKRNRDRDRDRDRDRERNRESRRDKDRDRERTKDKERSHKDTSSRSQKSSHKTSSHKSRPDRSRSRSTERKDGNERVEDSSKTLEGETKTRHRDREWDEKKSREDRRRDDKDEKKRDGEGEDRKRDVDRKSRKRSRSRHRSHGHHKRSRPDQEDKPDKHTEDGDRKSKSSRSSRRHSTRYEDDETAAERERRVEREREEERWGKR